MSITTQSAFEGGTFFEDGTWSIYKANNRVRDAQCMHCAYEPVPEERAEYERDDEIATRREALLKHIDARRGVEEFTSPERYSSGFIVEQAAYRFFELVDETEKSLRGRFNAEEMQCILNSTCTPIWHWNNRTSVAAMVAGECGVTSLNALPKGHPLHTLLQKLSQLTTLEDAVLVDVCERVWRAHDNPLL